MNARHRIPWLLILITIISVTRTHAATDKEIEYFPRYVGLALELDVELTDPGGKRTNGTMHRKFTEQVERNGKAYFKMRTWTDGSPLKHDATKLTRKDDTGLYTLDEDVPGPT